MPSKCRKKPSTIECLQWRGNNFQKLSDWLGKSNVIGRDETEDLSKRSWAQVWVQQIKSWVPLGLYDWVVKGPNGLEVCEHGLFQEQYDIVVFETLVPTEMVTG